MYIYIRSVSVLLSFFLLVTGSAFAFDTSDFAIAGPTEAGCAPGFPGGLKNHVQYNFNFNTDQNYFHICFDKGFKFSGNLEEFVDTYNSAFDDCFDLSVQGETVIVEPGPALCFSPEAKNYYCPHNKGAMEAEANERGAGGRNAKTCHPILEVGSTEVRPTSMDTEAPGSAEPDLFKAIQASTNRYEMDRFEDTVFKSTHAPVSCLDFLKVGADQGSARDILGWAKGLDISVIVNEEQEADFDLCFSSFGLSDKKISRHKSLPVSVLGSSVKFVILNDAMRRQLYVFTIDVINAHSRLLESWPKEAQNNQPMRDYITENVLEDDIVFDLLHLSCSQGGYQLQDHYPELIKRINSYNRKMNLEPEGEQEPRPMLCESK